MSEFTATLGKLLGPKIKKQQEAAARYMRKRVIKVETYAQTKEMVAAIRSGQFEIVIIETALSDSLSRLEITVKIMERPTIFSKIFGRKIVMERVAVKN